MVVTRPSHQAADFMDRIEGAGGQALQFPLLSIRPPRNIAPLLARLRRLPSYDWLIFISVNAVRMGLEAITRVGNPPTHAKIAAIGEKTADALRESGWTVDVVPKPPYRSETLLAEAALRRVSGCRCLIFRGEGGLGLLRESLENRGAMVDYAECYRRTPASPDAAVLERAWREQRLNVFTLTSSESLTLLIDAVGDDRLDMLLNTPLIVASDRIAQSATRLGWRATVTVADNATDEAMLEALVNWHRSEGALENNG